MCFVDDADTDMDSSPVRLVATGDVVNANAEFAASAVLALEVDNEYLLEVKQKCLEPIAAINSTQSVVQLETTQRLRLSLEKRIGALHSKFTNAKGGTARRKIREGKTKFILQEEDLTDIAAMREELRKKEVL